MTWMLKLLSLVLDFATFAGLAVLVGVLSAMLLLVVA